MQTKTRYDILQKIGDNDVYVRVERKLKMILNNIPKNKETVYNLPGKYRYDIPIYIIDSYSGRVKA